MIQFVKKYSLFFLIFFISIWVSLASTSLNEQFKFSQTANQVFTLLIYLPFFVLVFWKVITDFITFHVTKFNICYYVFAAYYALLTAFRFFTGAEVKEGIYYAVVLFGAFSLYALLTDKKLNLSTDNLSDNLFAILSYIVLYKVAVTFMEENVFGNPPINNLYSTSMLALLLPFIFNGLKEQKGWKATANGVLCCLSLVLIFTCSSRAVVLLSAALIMGLLLTFIKNVPVIKWFAVSFISSVILVSVLAGLNVGKVRYALYREFNISFVVSNNKDEPDSPSTGTTTSSGTTASTSTTTTTTTTVPKPSTPTTPPLSENTQEQINRSDAMRFALLKQGIAEVKKNILFGTGDLYYTYDMGYKTMEQTAHNFIIESLVCFGLIGTLLILGLFILILINFGFFTKTGFKNRKPWMFILFSCFYYFAFGLTQPSVFNTLVCPTFVMVIAYYGRLLCPENEKSSSIKTVHILGKGKAHVTDK